MAKKKMSDGFAGGWTRQSGDAIREVEERVQKDQAFTKMDIFTDEFQIGACELGPGQNPNKSSQPFQDKHSDYADHQLPSQYNAKVQKTLAAAGKASDQEMLDEIDDTEAKFNQGIKPKTSQFPGGPEKFWRNEHGLSKRIERKLKELK